MLRTSGEPLSASDLYPGSGSELLPAAAEAGRVGLPTASRRVAEAPAAERSAPIAPSLGIPAAALLRDGAERTNHSVLKRLFDITASLAGLLVLLPLFCLVALIVRLETPGPVLFRQRRAGVDGRVFQIYKFRSMRVLEDGETVTQASATDDRVTRFGAFLRRSCIDELPQLLNVIKGDMSLVGPRPHALAHDVYYSALIPEYSARLLVRPGIAGLAQVSGYRGATPTVESMAGRVKLDLEYIATWSLKQDMQILLRAVTEGPFHPAAF
jgi:lipopolysaccharide/colanic/teichoic acid biosynthesis glycosyltransferase